MSDRPAHVPDTDRLEATEEIIRERDERLARLGAEIGELQRTQRRLEAVNDSLSEQLDAILNSRGWRWLMRYRRFKERSGILGRWLPGGVRGPAAGRPRATAVAAPAEAPSRAERPVEAPPCWASVPLLPGVAVDAVEAMVARGDDRERQQHDVICFSIIDWEFRYQRPQQLMSQFAAHGHRVFYLSTSRFRPAGSAPVVRAIKDRVYEIQLSCDRVPDVYGGAMTGSVLADLVVSLAEVRQTYDISTAVCYVMVASWTTVAREAHTRWGWPLLYDCMDEWETFPGIKPALLHAEASLVEDADVLVVSAARLRDKWRARGRREPLVLARNAADYAFFAAHCQPNALLAGMPHPIVGYYGAIAEWFDVALAAHLARERPQYHFVFLGGVFDVDVSALRALPNVSLLGQQPYATMPEYLHHFDVCIIPFRVNPVTEATDPVKLYEFLSAGKPVVSVALPEVDTYREFVYLASDQAEFLAQLDRAVAERDPERGERRRALAAANTWADRYRAIETAITTVTPLASIVVVTHNNAPLTELCLTSLVRNTAQGTYEIVVVDNASSDSTPAYLRDFAERHPEVHLILNATNAGFSRANNQGLAASRGSVLVLLNNDTVVPPGWLPRLVTHLRDPAIGLVGPVTNFAGNEAKLNVVYRTIDEMEHFASTRARLYAGQIADISVLAMFCTAMRRDTFDETGPLDERFGIGMFEDDDYAHRVRATGRRVVCAGDVFVHHVGQAAFKTLIDQGSYDAIFDENRRRYEAKWGVTWTPHRHGSLQWQPAQATPPVWKPDGAISPEAAAQQ